CRRSDPNGMRAKAHGNSTRPIRTSGSRSKTSKGRATAGSISSRPCWALATLDRICGGFTIRSPRDGRESMIFEATKLAGAFIIDVEAREDSRGFFARSFCQHEFTEHGLKPLIA